MVQWLRVLAALAKNLGLIPSTYMTAQNHVYGSSSIGSDALFWLSWVPTSCTFTHVDTHTHTLLKKKEMLGVMMHTCNPSTGIESKQFKAILNTH